MAIKRIPIISSIDPEGSTGVIDSSTETLNCVYDRYADGTVYATQRPGITITAEAAGGSPVQTGIGRGIHYWARANSFYIVNDGRVQAGYGNPSSYIGDGRDKVHFAEISDYLVIIDPTNNRGWTISLSAPSDVVEISDPDFPPNQSPTRRLAGGVVTLDNFLFVLDTEGTVWQSALGDPTAWNALDFITAERERDTGTFIGKHHDQIVVMSSRSIEFFYNAGNPTGSVLSRRQDVSYRTGCISHNSIANTGDRLYFIGTEQSGTLGLYGIENFQLNKKTNMSIDEAISNLGLRRGRDFLLSFALINDHYSVIISDAVPVTLNGKPSWSTGDSYVLDETIGVWTKFATSLGDLNTFPVISIADKEQGTDRSVTMLFTNGDVVELTNILAPVDTVGIGAYFLQDDYLENQNDYIFSVTIDERANIDIQITINNFDNGSLAYKYGHSLWIVGTVVSQAQGTDPLFVSWSDDHYNTFSTPREVPTDMRRRLSRLGNFRRRAHQITYAGPDTVRIEALEMDVRSSRYA